MKLLTCHAVFSVMRVCVHVCMHAYASQVLRYKVRSSCDIDFDCCYDSEHTGPNISVDIPRD